MEYANYTVDEGEIQILLRETLVDDGSSRCSNQSPDIVVMDRKVYDPKKLMRETYDRDINDKADGSGSQYLYIRCRNLTDQPMENIYIHLFRNHLSLYNDPMDWAHNRMKTEAGGLARIPQLLPGEIGVAPAFLYDRKASGNHPNCFVAVASREKDPDFSWIHTSSDYSNWINRKNVAARNIVIRSVREGETIERLFVKNPYSYDIKVYFFAEVDPKKTDPGVEYGFFNIELGIEKDQVRNRYDPSDYRSKSLYAPAVIPSGFNGYLTAWTKSEGRRRSSVLFKQMRVVPQDSHSPLRKYAIPREHPAYSCMGLETGEYLLVPIGGCSLRYV